MMDKIMLISMLFSILLMEGLNAQEGYRRSYVTPGCESSVEYSSIISGSSEHVANFIIPESTSEKGKSELMLDDEKAIPIEIRLQIEAAIQAHRDSQQNLNQDYELVEAAIQAHKDAPQNSHLVSESYEKLTISPGCKGRVLYASEESGSLRRLLKNDLFLNSLTQTFLNYFGSNLEKLTPNEIINFLSSSSSARVFAKAFPAEGNGDSELPLYSEHAFYILNDTKEAKQYKVELELLTHDNKSQVQEYHYFVQPDEIRTIRMKMELTKDYPLQGEYSYSAITKVSEGSDCFVTEVNTVSVR